MDKYLFFKGEIVLETIEEFINENEFDLDSNYKIIIDSQGGHVVYGEIFTNFLNDLNSKTTVTLIAGNDVQSAATDLFLNFTGEIVIPELTVIMVHKASITHSTNESKKPMISHIKSIMGESNSKSLEDVYSKILTDKEIKDYKAGDEVYISRDRFIELKNIVNPFIKKENVKKIKKGKNN
jgi:ATP-dependent protease ClpP protease subunit